MIAWCGEGASELPSFNFTRVVEVFVKTDRLFIAPASAAAVEVLLLQVLLLLLLLLLLSVVFTAGAASGAAAASVGGRGRTVLAQAPEVFPTQVRGCFGLSGWRRDHRERDRRIVDGYLVATVTRIEVAAVSGRCVWLAARRVASFRFGCSGVDLVRQL